MTSIKLYNMSMSIAELRKFNALAADLSAHEERVRASILPTERIIGVGRYVMELGPHVGVFARAMHNPKPGAPDGIVIDFVAGDQNTARATVAGKATYWPYEGLVTVRDTPESVLLVVGLVRELTGIVIDRGMPDYPGRSCRVSEEELYFVTDFVAGSAEHPTAMHSFHFEGQPGMPVEGIVVTAI
jgi:hypothetical protein